MLSLRSQSEDKQIESSFLIESVIRKKDGKYYVYSKDGKKKLGGPYNSRAKAVKRLRQVEIFKRKGQFGKQDPFGKGYYLGEEVWVFHRGQWHVGQILDFVKDEVLVELDTREKLEVMYDQIEKIPENQELFDLLGSKKKF